MFIKFIIWYPITAFMSLLGDREIEREREHERSSMSPTFLLRKIDTYIFKHTNSAISKAVTSKVWCFYWC